MGVHPVHITMKYLIMFHPLQYTEHLSLLSIFVGNPDLESVFLAVGAVLGVLLVVLVTTVVIIVVLLICKR